MTKRIDNTEDIIDSRDVIARIGDLELELTASFEDWQAENEEERGDYPFLGWVEAKATEGVEEAAELIALLALQNEAEGCADWAHGEALIRDSYFEDYARDLADDIGAIPKDAGWPCTCIDWEQAARELRMDYSSVEFDGVTYWIRS